MLKLTIRSIEVEIYKFLDTKLPRMIAEPIPSMEYSLFGTSVGDGARFPSRYIWNVNALLDIRCDADIERKLGIIYQTFDADRRALENAFIELEDTTQEIQELTASMRPTVPATSSVVIGSYTSHYAVFNVWMTKPPEFSQMGKYKSVSFTLLEATL
jgi:hypothetical protein